MAAIPAGRFVVGATKKEGVVRSFCLDITEVTLDDYAKCVGDAKCTEPVHTDPNPDGHWGIQTDAQSDVAGACNWHHRAERGRHPVNCLDFEQATTYCRAIGRRLPTDDEWEWAARGGERGSRYPWGDSSPSASLVNACGRECTTAMQKLGYNWPTPIYDGDDGFAMTAPVGSFPKGANPWGVLDLVGNVAEWTASTSEWKEASGPVKTAGARGGTWMALEVPDLDIARPGAAPQTHRFSNLGFRCAATPP
jgi:formylglycine-generating enzyme required for sulfatase activity